MHIPDWNLNLLAIVVRSYCSVIFFFLFPKLYRKFTLGSFFFFFFLSSLVVLSATEVRVGHSLLLCWISQALLLTEFRGNNLHYSVYILLTEIHQRISAECPRTCHPSKALAECSFYCFIADETSSDPSSTYGEILQLNLLSITSMYLCQEN